MKKIVACLLLAGLALSFAGCNGSQNQTSVQPQQTSQQTVSEQSEEDFETDYLILVNRKNKLPDNYDKTVEYVTAKNSFGKEFKIEKETYEHYKELRESLLLQEIQIELNRVYLTPDEQEMLIQEYKNEKGEDYAALYAAPPYYSENQTGLGIDICLYFAGEKIDTNDRLSEMTGIFNVIHQQLSEYGFILRYPEGKEEITECGYQPWHIRYVGKENAQKITEKNLTLEEYLAS